MSLKDTYDVEKSKWNTLAQEKFRNIEKQILPPGEDFISFSHRSATHIGVIDFLGDLSDKHVLEYGCGLGQMSSLLAKNSKSVTTFDLSINSVRVTKKRAALNKVDHNIRTVVSAGERVPFADNSFDVIFGKAILHHLNVEMGWHDLYRVLKPGGKAVFIEPMGMNPILNFIRDHVPYPKKNPRGADSPLIYEEIHAWGKGFREFRYREIQLLSMLERGFGQHTKFQPLRRIDSFLLENLPFLGRFCRYVVMYMVK